MIWLRVAVRLALSAGVEQRWRQVCAAGTALITTVLVLCGIALLGVSVHGADVMRNRSPVWARPGDSGALQISLRGFELDDRQAVVVWLNPTAGHDNDPVVVPPGLRRLPDPGEAVVSPGLAARGYTAASLGFADSDAGLGRDGTIGPEGVMSDSDAWIYVRPPAGRSLGKGGALLRTLGYAVDGDERASLEASPDIPSPAMMAALLGWLLFLPAVFLLITGARALSPIRAERARLLHRLGISGPRIRAMLGVETAVLAGIGAVLGIGVWAVAVRGATHLPLTGATLQAGALEVPAAGVVLVAAGVTFVAASSGAYTLATRRARTRLRPASLRRVIPLAIGLATMLASRTIAWDAGGTRERLLVIGALISFAAFPLAAPPLAGRLGTVLSHTVRRPSLWLAGRRITFDSAALTRPATAVGMLVLVAGAAFAMYAEMVTPEPEQLALARHSSSIYNVSWRDPRPADLAAFTAALPDSRVYPLAQGARGDVIRVARCGDLDPLGHAFGVTACDGEVLTDAITSALASISLMATVAAPPASTNDVLVVGDNQLSATDIMQRSGGRLPALNISSAQPQFHPAVTTGWLVAGWVLASLLLITALLREIGDRALRATVEDSRLNRLGLSEREIVMIERFGLTVPLAVTIPVGYLGAVAYTVVGYELGFTIRSIGPITAVATGAAIGALGALLLAHHAGRRMQDSTGRR